ncbi:flagellar brake domain-containing protein [Anaerosalibacter massiliensis]
MIYLIIRPIKKGSKIPLYSGDIIKIACMQENKRKYMFGAKITDRKHKGIY